MPWSYDARLQVWCEWRWTGRTWGEDDAGGNSLGGNKSGDFDTDWTVLRRFDPELGRWRHTTRRERDELRERRRRGVAEVVVCCADDGCWPMGRNAEKSSVDPCGGVAMVKSGSEAVEEEEQRKGEEGVAKLTRPRKRLKKEGAEETLRRSGAEGLEEDTKGEEDEKSALADKGDLGGKADHDDKMDFEGKGFVKGAAKSESSVNALDEKVDQFMELLRALKDELGTVEGQFEGGVDKSAKA
eukprot:TRINITY_DN29881_c0_g1_i1.p1 TRINITY_DN29881_c0_g1~~TRINITY_DN29881_c0_g1_i1.p1  ORF type:complete len:242 (-),score=72.29 TRINITY_DN29881_c0_g1_i1:162-887(-)